MDERTPHPLPTNLSRSASRAFCLVPLTLTHAHCSGTLDGHSKVLLAHPRLFGVRCLCGGHAAPAGPMPPRAPHAHTLPLPLQTQLLWTWCLPHCRLHGFYIFNINLAITSSFNTVMFSGGDCTLRCRPDHTVGRHAGHSLCRSYHYTQHTCTLCKQRPCNNLKFICLTCINNLPRSYILSLFLAPPRTRLLGV